MTTVFGVDGCVLDLDATNSDSLTIVDGKVASWTDTAGGRVFSQANTSKRPTMGTLNGKQAVLGNRALLTELISDVVENVSRPIWSVVVGQMHEYPSVAPSAIPFQTGKSGDNFMPLYWQFATQKFRPWWKNGGNGSTVNQTLAPFLAQAVNTDTAHDLYFNGTKVTQVPFSTSTITGARARVLSTTSNEAWPGTLARVLVFDHEPTDLDLVNVEIGIAQQFDLAEVSHPSGGG